MPKFIGVLPAAGRGSRMGTIPCSKEIMPLGFQLQHDQDPPYWRPVTTLEQHIHALRVAGADCVLIIINDAKDDLVRYIGNGERFGLSVAFVLAPSNIKAQGTPGSINLAAPWIGEHTTLLALPDTLITPIDTMAQLAHSHKQNGADLTLGMFRTSTPYKFGMVRFDRQDEIVGFVDKPPYSDLVWMWGIAAWSERFTKFLDAFLAQASYSAPEIVLSEIFEASLKAGLNIQGIKFERSQYHDTGTPEDFQAVVALTARRGQQNIE